MLVFITLYHNYFYPLGYLVGLTSARKLDVQIFATTHSYECLVAAHKATSRTEEHDLKVYRLERHNEHKKLAEYSKGELDFAIGTELETRWGGLYHKRISKKWGLY